MKDGTEIFDKVGFRTTDGQPLSTRTSAEQAAATRPSPGTGDPGTGGGASGRRSPAALKRPNLP